MYLKIVQLILLTTAITPHLTNTVGYLNWGNAKMEPGMMLLNHVFSTLDGIRSRLECQRFCIENNNCKSYNFDKILKICQLNNIGRNDANQADFQKNKDYVYADFYDETACMTQECCLNTSTSKNKENLCYTQIKLEKDDSMSSSSEVVLKVRLTSGKGDYINMTCSDGVESLTTGNANFSEDVFVSCTDVPASSLVTVNIYVSYLGMPAVIAGITVMSKGSPVTFEELFTNSSTAVATWSLPKGEFTDEFFVGCSDGTVAVLSQNSSSGSAVCRELLPGSSVVITVNSSRNSVAGEPASLTMYLEPDMVEFIIETISLVYVSVDWNVKTGTASEFVANCSTGHPESSIVTATNGAGRLNCSGLSPGIEVDITVTAIENGKKGSPATTKLSTDDYLKVTLTEDTLSNTDTVVVRILTVAPQGGVLIANCSAGILTTNGTYNILCSDLQPGQNVYVNVKVRIDDQIVGSGGINVTSVPATVLLFEKAEVLELPSDGEAFAFATFNLTSGEADSFIVTCSNNSYAGTYDANLAKCEVLSDAEVIEITVKARRGDKIGNPTTINASVIRRADDTLTSDETATLVTSEVTATFVTSEVTYQLNTSIPDVATTNAG